MPDRRGSSASSDMRARVFISYARKNAEPAERLRAALVDAGFDAYLDVHDIKPGEPWQERLAALIATAEKVVYLISPDSVASEICGWEIDEAEGQSKSVLPVVIRETDMHAVPGRLRRLNFIFMRDEAEWASGVAALTAALSTDLAWEREKTRINELATLWQVKGRPFSRLVFSPAGIEEMERWRDSHPASAPPPTETQLAFIAASRRAHGRRQFIGTAIAAGVAVFFAGLALYSYDLSIKARLGDVVATLRSGNIESAGDKFRSLAAAPLVGLWGGTAAARATASELLDTAVVLAPPYTEAFAETTGAQGSEPPPGGDRHVACTPKTTACVAFYYRDARATVRSFYVLGDADHPASKALSADPFSPPEGATEFFQPPISTNAFAISDDGALIAVTQDQTVRFWYWTDIAAGNIQPYRTLTLDFAPQKVGFEPDGRILAATGVAADGSKQARVIDITPRLLLGGPLDRPSGTKTDDTAKPPPESLPIAFDAKTGALDIAGLAGISAAKLSVPADLRDAIGRAAAIDGAKVYAVGPRILAMPVGNSDCTKAGGTVFEQESGGEATPDDLLVLHLAEDDATIAKAWLIVCGPTLRGFPELAATLTVSHAYPANKVRHFISDILTAGIYELGDDGRPLALYALCDKPKKLEPHATDDKSGLLTTVRFDHAPICQMASHIIYHGNYDRLSFYADRYNSPSGDRQAHYLDLATLKSGTYDSPVREYFDKIVNMWCSPSGDLLATYKDTSGIELFDVASRAPVTIPKSITQLNFDAHGAVVMLDGRRMRLAVPEVADTTFGALGRLLGMGSTYTLKPASKERRIAYWLVGLDAALNFQDHAPATLAAARAKGDAAAQQVLALAPEKAPVVTMKLTDFEVRAGEGLLKQVRPPDLAAARKHFEAAIRLRPDQAGRLRARWADSLISAAAGMISDDESTVGMQPIAPETADRMNTLVTKALDVLGDKGDPDVRARAEYWLGHLALNTRNYKDAIAAFSVATEHAYKYATGWLWRTRILAAYAEKTPAATLDRSIRTYLEFDPQFRSRMWPPTFLFDLSVPAEAIAKLYLTHGPPVQADPTRCDRLARNKVDPFGSGPPTAFADLKPDEVIAACTEALKGDGVTDVERARYLYQRGRANYARANAARDAAERKTDAEAARADLEQSAAMDYPAAGLALGDLLPSNLLGERDVAAGAIATGRAFNEIVRCCAVAALADAGEADGISPKVRSALLDWAAVLNRTPADATTGGDAAAPPDASLVESGPDWMLPACNAQICKGKKSSKFRSFRSLFPPTPGGDQPL